MELAVPRFVLDARKNGLSRTDCFGPLDSWIPANPLAAQQPPGSTRRRSRRGFESSTDATSCGCTSKNFGDFTWSKFSNHHLRAPVLKERKAVSLPCGTSAFARKPDPRRVSRMVIEGASPSIRLRARFPLPPSRSAMEGVSIEVEDESVRRPDSPRDARPRRDPGAVGI